MSTHSQDQTTFLGSVIELLTSMGIIDPAYHKEELVAMLEAALANPELKESVDIEGHEIFGLWRSIVPKRRDSAFIRFSCLPGVGKIGHGIRFTRPIAGVRSSAHVQKVGFSEYRLHMEDMPLKGVSGSPLFRVLSEANIDLAYHETVVAMFEAGLANLLAPNVPGELKASVDINGPEIIGLWRSIMPKNFVMIQSWGLPPPVVHRTPELEYVASSHGIGGERDGDETRIAEVGDEEDALPIIDAMISAADSMISSTKEMNTRLEGLNSQIESLISEITVKQ